MKPPEGGYLIEGTIMTSGEQRRGHYRSQDSLRELETTMYAGINAAYARATLDRQPISVEPSASPKPMHEGDVEALREATARVGHLTGSIAVRETQIG